MYFCGLNVGILLTHIATPQRKLCQNCLQHLHRLQRSSFTTSSRLSGVFEPDGLSLEPEIPEYESLCISMKGFDYVVLESFAKFVHNITDALQLNSDNWPLPGKSLKIKVYQPNSVRVKYEYNLTKYERIVQLEDLPSPMLPLIIEYFQINAPEGVEFSVRESDPDELEKRYVPDKLLLDYKQQLSEIKKDLKKPDI